MRQVLTIELKTGETLSDGVEGGGVCRHGGKGENWASGFCKQNVTKQLNMNFVFDCHLGIGHG